MPVTLNGWGYNGLQSVTLPGGQMAYQDQHGNIVDSSGAVIGNVAQYGGVANPQQQQAQTFGSGINTPAAPQVLTPAQQAEELAARAPGQSQTPIDPYVQFRNQPGGGRVQGGPYMQYQGPPMGYPQMPGYPGGMTPVGRAPDGMNLIYPDGSQTQIGVGQSPFGTFGRNGMGTMVDDTRVQGGPYMRGGVGSVPNGAGSSWGGAVQGGPYMQYGTPSPQLRPPGTPPKVPLAHQMAPWVWDSLSPMGKELAYGAIEQTGQDPGEYENALNKARPQGQAPRMTSTRYAPSQSLYGRF